MRVARVPSFAQVPFLLTVSFVVSLSHAQDSDDAKSAQVLVARALHAEMRGDSATRSDLLTRAIAADAEHAPARWHSGQIQVDGEWRTLSEVADYFHADPRLEEYRDKRARISGTPSEELGLARWCRRNGLPEWGDTHLIRVVYSDQSSSKERASAAKLLNWTNHRGIPVPASDLPKIKKMEREHRESLAKWRQRISKLTENLSHRNNATRDEAIAELRSIEDVNAIGALESILSPISEQASLLTISILGGIPDHAATQSLVRHAVLSPWPAVSNSATAQLRSRPVHDYLPYLLGALETPIHFATGVEALPSGQVVRNFALFREGVRQDRVHVGQVISNPAAVLPRQINDENGSSTVAQRPPLPRTIGNNAAVLSDDRARQFQNNRVVQEVQRTEELRQRVAAENLRIAQDNGRVYDVLERVVDARLPRNPVDWWGWWRDHNDVYDPAYEYGKPTVVTSSSQTDFYPSSVQMHECFVEGTNVWSETGPVPIQDLRIGDRVLTQDPDTGELSFQGIVDCTVRPPADIVRVTVAGDTTPIESTKGHPFWVNGSGWKMAKEIEVGEWLHTVSGPVEVASIETLPVRQPAYNLLVAGNGCYFVGPLGLLVHDNTYRAPTLSVVPGLASVSR